MIDHRPVEVVVEVQRLDVRVRARQVRFAYSAKGKFLVDAARLAGRPVYAGIWSTNDCARALSPPASPRERQRVPPSRPVPHAKPRNVLKTDAHGRIGLRRRSATRARVSRET